MNAKDTSSGRSGSDHDDRPGRRKILAGLGIGGIGGAVLGAPGIAGAQTSATTPNHGPNSELRRDNAVGSFIRLFPELPAFALPSADLTEALVELGRPGGLLDAKDPLELGPRALIDQPELSPNNRDNPTQTAGSTFMGQFLDHDITSDAGSSLGVPTPAPRSTNLRSARFDLDTVYGGGPRVSPELYESDNELRFRVESGGVFEDLPRTSEGAAVIADPRNDENLIISGLHAAFLKFHNAVIDSDGVENGRRSPRSRRFARAQQTVRWHYQWLIVNQFLPQYVGPAMVDDVLRNGRRFFTPTRARIPLEFQVSAFRMGHSMIRPSYRANLGTESQGSFVAFVFDPSQMGQPDPDDLSGRSRAPRRFIDWQNFFDFGDGAVLRNKRVETSISSPLFNLPTSTISSPAGEPLGPTSLATRNLLRHITWQIPSGQSVAAHMGAPVLAPGDLADVADISPELAASTPLWLYILREASVFADGLHLGPVGGRILAEVFIGLLEMDPGSYLYHGRRGTWTPTLPSMTLDFRMIDLLTFAGVDPTSRRQ